MVGNGVVTGVLGDLAACVVVCVRGPCGGLQLVFCLVGVPHVGSHACRYEPSCE